MTHPATQDLFERARQGGSGDLNAFYERCARKLLPIVRLRLGRSLRSEIESRDIVQAVLCRSLDRLDTIRDPGAVMAWLARIAENEIRDLADFHGREKRDAARRVQIEAAAEVAAPVRQAISRLVISDELARVEQALDALPPPQRELIVLRKLEELTFAEIGSRLGKSEDACRVAFSRAMAALTLQLGQGHT